jgi:hypothetical protein
VISEAWRREVKVSPCWSRAPVYASEGAARRFGAQSKVPLQIYYLGFGGEDMVSTNCKFHCHNGLKETQQRNWPSEVTRNGGTKPILAADLPS